MSYDIPYIKLSVELNKILVKSVEAQEALFNPRNIYTGYKNNVAPMYFIENGSEVILTRVNGSEVVNVQLFIPVVDRLKNYK